MEVGVLLFCIIVLAVLIGVLGIAGIGFLYWKSYPRVELGDLELIRELHFELLHGPPHDTNAYALLLSRYYDMCGDLIPDTFAKRQSFWSSYVQFALSLLVVVFITVLLLLKIVTAEAGLPILAAFGGAALSQGVSSVSGGARGRTEPPILERREGGA